MVSEVEDQSIVNQYNKTDLNVLEIAEKHDLLVWQVVSILMNNGVIGKLGDARGYDLYKETEEYKSKITNKS